MLEQQLTIVKKIQSTVPTVLPMAKNKPIMELEMPCSSRKKMGPTARLYPIVIASVPMVTATR